MYSILAPLYAISLTWWLVALMLFLIIAVIVDKTSKNNQNSKYNLPPGPKGLPILGTFPSFLRAPAHVIFEEWSKKYGNVYKFTLGIGTSVVLGNVETVREAFITRSPDVDSRCQWRYCFIRMFRGLSVLPYSMKWMNTRRRTLTILRDFGMGRSFMEDRIHEDTLCLMKCMLEAGDNGKRNFEPRDMLRRSPMNILCTILFRNKRYDYDNPSLLYVMNTVLGLVDFLAKASIYDILPSYLRNLTGFSLRYFHKELDNLNNFMKERVEEHKQAYNKNATNNFIDAWLKACDEDKLKVAKTLASPVPSSGHEKNEYSELHDVLQDIVIAGAHSTGIVFNWSVLLLVLNKPEQDKAYTEIMENIGPDRVPSMSDRSKLRYVEAIINEVLRIATVLPLVAQATGRDTVIGGYNVPANIEVIYNNWTLNRDEKVFPDPYTFKPSRWLDQDGKIRKELFNGFFPFGLGKRSCPGESLARMDLFISLTTLIQNLEFSLPDDTVSESLKPTIDHQFGLLADCKPFSIRARKRPTSVLPN